MDIATPRVPRACLCRADLVLSGRGRSAGFSHHQRPKRRVPRTSALRAGVQEGQSPQRPAKASVNLPWTQGQHNTSRRNGQEAVGFDLGGLFHLASASAFSFAIRNSGHRRRNSGALRPAPSAASCVRPPLVRDRTRPPFVSARVRPPFVPARASPAALATRVRPVLRSCRERCCRPTTARRERPWRFLRCCWQAGRQR